MHGFVKHLFWCAVSAAILAALGGAAYRGFGIWRAGYALDAVPPLTMAFDVMRLHVLAAYGAGVGVALGVLVAIGRIVTRRIVALFRRPPAVPEQADADALIRAERAQRADAYLSSLERRTLDHVLVAPAEDEEGPDVENFITARGGTFTFRVLAYRHLTEQERMAVVSDALRLGYVREPLPGGTTTVLTAIGK